MNEASLQDYSHSLNLSRWHRVVERLNEALARDSKVVEKTFTSTRVSSWNNRHVADYLYLEKAEADQSLARHAEILKAIGLIRRNLGETNARLGISQLITEAELLNRRIKLLERITDGQSADMVDADYLLELAATQSTPEGKNLSYTVNVRLLDAEEREGIRNELNRLRLAHHTMMDKVSDLNRERITLSLSEEISEIGGLNQTRGL